VRRAWAAVLIGTALAGASLAATEPEGPPAASADRALLERVMAEAHVEGSPRPPSWAAYGVDLIRAAFEAMGRRLRPAVEGLGALGPVLVWAAWALVALLAAALVFLIAQVILARRQRRQPERPQAAPRGREAPEPRERAGWRAEIERQLTAGDVTGALAALWWWLACSVAGSEIDGSWTTRELLARAGRRDLTPQAQSLDRLMYGPGRAAPADVRRLLEGLESLVG
jgi:hypothetical protein